MSKIRVTIWNEFRHEKKSEEVAALYPNGLHSTIKGYLEERYDEFEITLAALDDEFQGLPDERLENTDVLIWWGHTAHKEVDDDLVKKIQNRVYQGKMGFIALHSAHKSKPFRAIVGTNGALSWGRNQKEVVWNMLPSHPIAAGIPDHFVLESEELYAEPFFVGKPDDVVFGSWFEDGYIFRSGICFNRAAGKAFYFQPGHETCKSFHNPIVIQIIANAINWVKPNDICFEINGKCPHLRTSILDEFPEEE